MPPQIPPFARGSTDVAHLTHPDIAVEILDIECPSSVDSRFIGVPNGLWVRLYTPLRNAGNFNLLLQVGCDPG